MIQAGSSPLCSNQGQELNGLQWNWLELSSFEVSNSAPWPPHLSQPEGTATVGWGVGATCGHLLTCKHLGDFLTQPQPLICSPQVHACLQGCVKE